MRRLKVAKVCLPLTALFLIVACFLCVKANRLEEKLQLLRVRNKNLERLAEKVAVLKERNYKLLSKLQSAPLEPSSLITGLAPRFGINISRIKSQSTDRYSNVTKSVIYFEFSTASAENIERFISALRRRGGRFTSIRINNSEGNFTGSATVAFFRGAK